MPLPSEDEDWEEEEEDSSTEDENEGAGGQDPPKSAEASGSSEAEESESEITARKTMMKRKRKTVEAKKKAKIGGKKAKKDKPSTSESNKGDKTQIIDEKSHQERKEEKDKKTATKTGKKEYKMFNDKNLDIDFHKDPDSIVGRRIRLNGSYIITCKTIQMNGNGDTGFDYAAVIIEKKMKDSRCFEFNFPLTLAPRMIDGLKEIIKENPKFFNHS